MIKKLCILTFLVFGTIATSFAQIDFLNETFSSNSMPNGWQIQVHDPVYTDGGWRFGSTTAMQSEFWPIPTWSGGNIAATNDDACNCNKLNDRLLTPSVDLSSADNAFISFDYFFNKGTYQGKTEAAFLEASTDGGLTWSTLHEFTGGTAWRNYIADISQFAGESTLWISFRYSDDDGWLYGFALDNVKIYQAPQYDLAATSLNLPEYALNNQPLSIAGSLRNLGAATISDLQINYQINNGSTVSGQLTGLNIMPGATYNFNHPIAWTPSSEGLQSIRVWADELNGNNDQVNSNDTITGTVYISNQLAVRKVLFEQFTSNTCGPCASVAPTVANLLNANNVNTEAGKVISIKYHQDFPQPGTDAAYTAESNARRTYYGFSGIPAAAVSGNAFNGHPVGLTQDVIDQVYARPTIFNIDVRSSYVNNTVSAEVDLTSLVNFTTPNTRLHVAIIENQINNLPGGTTSQTVFTHVNRKMLPNQSGTAIPNMTTNQTQTFTFTHTLSNVFSSMSGISVIAFVQNNDTREVYQSNSKGSVLNAAQGESFPLTLFPNPASDDVFISFESKTNEQVLVRIFNLEGKMIKQQNFGRLSGGEQLLQIDNSNLENGLYFYQIIKGDAMITRKVSILK